MRRGCVLSALMLVVLLRATPASAASFTFESLFDPATNRLDVNIDVVDVADLLPGSFGFLGFDFDISFSPLMLSADPLFAVDAVSGNFLTRVSLPFLASLGDPFSGTLTVISALLGPVATGATLDGRLVTISFFDVIPGVDPNVSIANMHFTRLIDPSLEFPEVDLVDVLPAVVPPAVIPEPSTLALVAIGLVAMRQRRKAIRRGAVR